MAKCVYCQAETEMYLNEVPVCIHCDRKTYGDAAPPARKPNLLETNARLTAARSAWRVAILKYEEAEATYLGLPSGHPDGSNALYNANQRLHKAAEEFKDAMQDYLAHGGKRESA